MRSKALEILKTNKRKKIKISNSSLCWNSVKACTFGFSQARTFRIVILHILIVLSVRLKNVRTQEQESCRGWVVDSGWWVEQAHLVLHFAVPPGLVHRAANFHFTDVKTEA